jgi:hypothetical protein
MVGQLGSAVMVQQSVAVKEPMAQERERKRRWMAALESGVVEAEHMSAAFGGHEVIHCAGACNNARLSNALAIDDRKRRLNKRVESRKRVFTIIFLGKDQVCLILISTSRIYISITMNNRIIFSGFPEHELTRRREAIRTLSLVLPGLPRGFLECG